MNIYVVRHGQTDYNQINIYQGQTDVKLNDTGIIQAKELAKKFENMKIDNILVSPLSRAQETAQYISEVIGISPKIENGLIERSFGDMEGKHNRENCNLEILLDYDKNYNEFNIEPIQTLFKRVNTCMDKIIKKYKSQNIILVTHAGVGQAIDCYFNGLPLDKNLAKLALKTGEIRKYSI